MKHSFGSHTFDPSFRIVCGIRGCQHTFLSGSSFYSFKTHANRKHRDWKDVVNDPASVGVTMPLLSLSHACTEDEQQPMEDEQLEVDLETPGTDSQLVTVRDQIIESQSVVPVCPVSLHGQCHDAQQAAALFLLTFQEKYELSQKAIDFAVGSIHTILDSVRESAALSIQDLTETLSTPPAFDEIIACIEDHEHVFGQLQTKHSQNKFYIDKFGLVVNKTFFILSPDTLIIQEPVTIELGTTYEYRRSRGKRRLFEVSETFQYVPLIENLQWLLQNKDIYNEVK